MANGTIQKTNRAANKRKLRVAVLMGGPSSEHEVSLKSGAMVVKNLDPKKYAVTPVVIGKDGRWPRIYPQNTPLPRCEECARDARRAEDAVAPALQRRQATPQPAHTPATRRDTADCPHRGVATPSEYPADTPSVVAPSAAGQSASIAARDILGIDSPPETLKNNYDLAFIAMHGEYGEDGTIQALLESLGVPFTGSDAKASRLGMDKTATARAFKKAGLNIPPTVNLGRVKKFPFVIKPADRGSSVGVSIVKNHSELEHAITEAKKYSPNIIAQQFISGREFTCGVLEMRGKPTPLPPTEIVVKRGVFFDFDAKYTPNATEEVTPPKNLSAAKIKALQHAALKAHKAIHARGISRTDMMMDRAGKIYILEINTIPGMTETSLVPQEAKAYGLTAGKLLDQIVVSALFQK